MAKIVKCYYCGQQFDRTKEDFIAVNGRRYAHKKCYEQNQANKTQSEKDYEALISYIKKIFGYTVIPTKVTRQITSYKKEYNFTYSGMLKALVWWFEIKNHTIEAANGGIGIVPYIYNDAKTYYYSLYKAQNINKEKTISTRVEEIEIQSPRVKISPQKLFTIEEEENE